MAKYHNVKPSDDYKTLKTQFYAMRHLLASKDIQFDYYYNKIKEFDFKRIIELEAELASEKEMNAILTEELENYYNKYG